MSSPTKAPAPPPQSRSSPARSSASASLADRSLAGQSIVPSSPGRSHDASTVASIPMTYSMDTAGDSSAALNSLNPPPPQQRRQHSRHPPQPQPQSLPPAYALQRSERDEGRGGAAAVARGGSFATAETTEDSITRSVDDTEFSTTTGDDYAGLQGEQRRRQLQMGAQGGGTGELAEYYESPTRAAHAGINGGPGPFGPVGSYERGGDDAAPAIRDNYRGLLTSLSSPELFREALSWQEKLDSGLDPSAEDDGGGNGTETGGGNNAGLSTFETEFEDDSTFRGLGDETDDGGGGDRKASYAQNETFEFNPNAGDSGDSSEDRTTTTGGDASSVGKKRRAKRREPPLPIQIFAHDAESVLPQALTASQLFGSELAGGVELEAASGIEASCRLFLRWLALMPEGDHTNVVDPPGLTIMRIRGGGYRVTGAHRVVWRWMNKFSPAVTGDDGVDFDFGDLVSMTIVDVFETDADGKLLSYCPTFDNRSVHRTPEAVERLRKGATQLREAAEAAARSPAGKAATTAGRMGFRAAMVVGNAVRNRMQHQQRQGGGGGDVPEEDDLNELLQSQIATEDETEADAGAVDSSALEEDPTASPGR
ncbi:hypothetical protein ACHAWF_009183 [Thalassiosira exigua]